MDETKKDDALAVAPEANTEVKREETKPVETKAEEVKVAEVTTAPAEAKAEETTTPTVAEETGTPAAEAAPAVDVDDAMEDVPDPDEDDLDDLDDLLDDFSAAKIESKAPATAAPAAAAPPTIPAPTLPPGLEDDADMEALLNDEDFAKQLQAGMADLIGEIEKSPDVQAQFESLFKEFGLATDGSGGNVDLAAAAAAATGQAAAAHVAAQTPPGGPSTTAKSAPKAAASSSKPAPAAAAGGDASFQDTIRRTMERMQASGDQATAAAAADSENTDDMLSEFMKQLQSGGLGGAGGGNEEDLTKMLMGMMEELTNKEILYEPMKELDDKFPAWMEANRSTTSAEDLKRYEEQQVIVREIVTRFELPSYSDTNPEHREYIVDRMQKMQAAGSPPPDLVGDMPSAQEALAVPDESCPQQ
ncbi:Peroxisome chaperone and import receptor [Sporothrix bragantina]|uniref:Peroxisome chaperone and import receptor n=1 Tax=Sporothrix bragantina TaxID=671064 RepID=A0ABP0B181_9PEZI